MFPSSASITLRVGPCSDKHSDIRNLSPTQQIGDRSRASAGLSMDGQVSHVLSPGESVTVHASLHPIPCINRSSIVDPDETRQEPYKEDDWVRDINNLLQYNATFRSKALTRHSRS